MHLKEPTAMKQSNFIIGVYILVTFFSSKYHCYVNIKPRILSPPLIDKPFIVMWNVASQRCEEKFGIKLDLDKFGIIHNPDKGWRGSTLTIFYADQLGLYPKIENGTVLNGGLPQDANLYKHLDKAAEDIKKAIPDEDFQGLAVIDWEAWLPLFSRTSFGKYLVYRNMSIEQVKKKHPEWTPREQFTEAEMEYNVAAKTFIDFTLALGKLLRPKALWGLYLYPDCYNYDKSGKRLSCTNDTLHHNDEIQWVFDDSTALYPSVYLGEWFKNKDYATEYVANRIKEATRVDGHRPGNVSIPVFPYHSITYRKEPDLVDLFDLRDSIGVASVLGASGMVIWGDYNVANSHESCQNLSDYIEFTLGPYCEKTTKQAAACSKRVCNGNGRCITTTSQKNGEVPDSPRYLTTDEALKLGRSEAAYLGFQGEDVSASYSVVCQCFSQWRGDHCQFRI